MKKYKRCERCWDRVGEYSPTLDAYLCDNCHIDVHKEIAAEILENAVKAGGINKIV